MNASRPLSTPAKWMRNVFGFAAIGGSIWLFVLAALSFQLLSQSEQGLLGGDGTMLAHTLGRLMGGILLAGVGIWVLQRGGKPRNPAESADVQAVSEPAPAPVVALKAAPRQPAKRCHSANVLQVGPVSRHLWHFSVSGGQLKFEQEFTASGNDPLPRQAVARNVSSLWRRKLNIAWLPAENAFLRVVHLPASDFSEVFAMVELQLEKLSPIPVTQVVWSLELLPNAGAELQTAIVVIAERSAVEEFLGKIEGQGYIPDRLEVPALDQLLANDTHADGVWVYLPANPNEPSLVAWWVGGVLQNITLISLPAGPESAPLLKEKIDQIAWAGELEGWLAGVPVWHLVAEPEVAAVWKPLLDQWADQPIGVTHPVPARELATRTARRAAGAHSSTGLLPPEHAARFQQQFVDRLWMGGLFAVIGLYIVGVLAYFAALGVLQFQLDRVKADVRSLGPAYTNAVQLEARIEVLLERKNLQFAALDCWRVVAELLPLDVTLTSMTLDKGEKLSLIGTVPVEFAVQITEFNQAMRNAVVDGKPMFRSVSMQTTQVRGQNVEWRFDCFLRAGGSSR